MISLEQVKLLESKVARAIDYVKRVTGENKRLESTLESYQKRIDELEVLVQCFKEDQGKIEDGILSALDRLNQFEDALETVVSHETVVSRETPVSRETAAAPEKSPPAKPPVKAASGKKAPAAPAVVTTPTEPKAAPAALPVAAAEDDLFGEEEAEEPEEESEESIEIDREAAEETEPEIF